ncbi:MAG: hypothetical protein ABMB14_24940 [Myxococcota bacterium]
MTADLGDAPTEPARSGRGRIPWRRVVGFLVVGLVFHLALYLPYTRIVRAGHKAVRSDRAFVLTAPREISLLVCGDSHPRTAIDPGMLGDDVVNIAIGGEHYLKTWYRMRALVERTGRTVDTLLLPLDAGSFSGWHAENFAPEFVWGRYVDFLEIGRVRGDRWDYVGRQLKASIFPYAGELRTINQLRTKRFGFGEDLPTGSFGDLSVPERRLAALTQAKEHFKDADLMDPGLRWAFDSLIRWADEHGVKVVLVAFPVTAMYDGWVQRLGIRERVQREVVDPVTANPNHVYLDFHDLFAGRDHLFSDPHHLNAAGRVAFSRRLRTALVDRGLLPAGPDRPPTPGLDE